ncbi:MAG: sigma-54-dependent Fis family transcriptional regulator [Betaproteobacteria bacterium TMED156]|nr:MAG: sigma-54-dependent Fis family transcriptional regulator [Betaproteobacteria bacterium TMED156]
MNSLSKILGVSSQIQELKNLIETMASSDATVLILGESGTGKELVARNLHNFSNRSRYKFVAVNCAAIPRDLIESELFGHRKGSFTGALSDRLGRFELANGGTLFLDEIGDLPSEVQVKLLRVIQERVVDPIGAHKSTPIDVRIISATHRDLEVEIKDGRFREDLFYRLNVLPIHTPPLRDRNEDLSILIENFANQFARKGGKPIKVDNSLMKAFKQYSWPGNIRELSNICARLSTLFPGKHLSYDDIPQPMLPKGLRGFTKFVKENIEVEKNPVEDLILLTQGSSLKTPDLDNILIGNNELPLKERLADIEKNFIKQALVKSGGNVSKTARLLSVQRTTLIEKINKYSLDTP